jgi:hypothetical protein
MCFMPRCGPRRGHAIAGMLKSSGQACRHGVAAYVTCHGLKQAKAGMDGMNSPRPNLKSKALHEAKKFFWIFIYLWLCFGLFVLYESLILAEHHINYTGFGLALVKALVLGKVILVAEGLHVAERHKEKPLIYPTLYKSFVFFVLLVLFSMLEQVVRGFFEHKAIAESLSEIGGGSLPTILARGLIMFVVLVPFFAFREIGRVLGENKLYQLFFVEGAKAATERSTARQHKEG